MDSLKLAAFFLSALLAVGGAVAGAYGWVMLMVVGIASGGIGMIWAAADGMWERHNTELDLRRELVRERTRFAATIGGTDKETRAFLAREWPEMGIEFGEESLMYVLKDGVNTQVLIPFLRVFLLDSNERYFVDLRTYNDDKYLQARFEVPRDFVRAQWTFATEFLTKVGYLAEGSMAGNRTWQWTTREHYKKLLRRYGNVREIERLP